MKTKILFTLATAFVVTATASFAAVNKSEFSLSPMIGGYVYDKSAQGLDSSVMIGGRVGYNFTSAIGIEALYDYVVPSDSSKWNLRNISMHRLGGQALYHFFPDKKFVPFLAAGYSRVIFSGTDVNSSSHGSMDYGVGAKYFVTDNIAVRGDLRHIFYEYDSVNYNNVEFALGAYMQFGAVAPAAKPLAPALTPEPVKSVAAAVPPPEPVKIAPVAPEPIKPVFVPPVDSDFDGVPDILDKCPNTPAGTVVDSDGCPVDTDKDGIPDFLDKCPNTPAGTVVDSAGCPVDTDKDGIPDYLDKCPNTPAGTVVDSAGCPIDTDKDGIPDYLDKCPNTPAGILVDASGCPVEVAKKFCNNPTVIAISFDTGKSNIKPKYFDELNSLGSFLKEFPNSRGTIKGHTDSEGGKEHNLKLSQERTDSVRSYIINKFNISGDRISAKGYGSSQPIASNKTESGKAKNRRIEAVFTCD